MSKKEGLEGGTEAVNGVAKGDVRSGREVTGTGAKVEGGNIKNLGLPGVCGCNGSVVRDSPFEWGNGGEDRGVLNEVLEVRDG